MELAADTPAPTLGSKRNLIYAIYAGIILGLGNLAVLFGKIIMGQLADQWGGRKAFLFAMATSTNPNTVALMWILHKFLQAGGWTAMGMLVRSLWTEAEQGKVLGVVATSSRAGAILGSLIMTVMLAYSTWRQALILTVTLGFLVLALDYNLLPDTRPASHATHSLLTTFNTYSRSPQFWLTLAIYAPLLCTFELESFLPLYLTQLFGVSASMVSFANACFSTGAISSVSLLGNLWEQREHRRNLGTLMLLGMCLACGLLLYFTFAASRFGSEVPSYVFPVLLTLYGFGLGGPFYLPTTTYTMQNGGANMGALMGVLEAFGYAGAMVTDYTFGELANPENPGGWISIATTLLFFAVLATSAFFVTTTLEIQGVLKRSGPLT